MCRTLYLDLADSVVVSDTEVTLGDLANVIADDKELEKRVSLLPILSFDPTIYCQASVSVMVLIQKINQSFPGLVIQSIGDTECLVNYEILNNKKKPAIFLRWVLLLTIAFLGSCFSIMSYNTDAGTDMLLKSIHFLFWKEHPTGPTVGTVFYAIGLFTGLVIFFNHGIFHRISNDPTPLEVQIRSYEEEMTTAVKLDNKRNKRTLDIGKTNTDSPIVDKDDHYQKDR